MRRSLRLSWLWGRKADQPRSKTRTKPLPEALAVTASAMTSLKIDGIAYVFGLDWRMVPPSRRLKRALNLGRQEGMAWYAVNEMQDMVGYLGSPKWLRGHHYSACLHLASRHSQGGLELFAFSFADGRHGVLALQESRPLPGFDYLGEIEVARSMVEDFLAIQRGQPIRLIGNTSFLEGQELVAPEDLFTDPVKDARLRSLRSWRAVRKVALLGLVGLGLAAGGHYWLERQRQETQLMLQNSPTHQQKLYDEGLRRAWAALPPAANEVLRAWYDTVSTLPLHWKGWKLARIECQVDQCRAHWQRLHGSYASFLIDPPIGAKGIEDNRPDEDLTVGQIVTRHPLVLRPTEAQRPEDLPGSLVARRGLVDLLQDLQLLGKGSFRIEPAKLFAGQQNPELLNEAVVHGRWKLRHALWIWPGLNLPDYTRVHSLTLHLVSPASQTGSRNTEPRETQDQEGERRDSGSPEAGFTEPYFEINGAYYAQK
jgi:hypothetical protein